MYSRDIRDILGGGIVTLFGFGFATYSHLNYDIGTLFNMGPGMYPAGVGYLLVVLGLLIVVPAFFRRGEPLEIAWRPVLTILGAVFVFILTIDFVGMIPAVALTTLVSSLAEERPQVGQTVVMTVFLVAFCVLVFSIGLGLPISIAKWPF